MAYSICSICKALEDVSTLHVPLLGLLTSHIASKKLRARLRVQAKSMFKVDPRERQVRSVLRRSVGVQVLQRRPRELVRWREHAKQLSGLQTPEAALRLHGKHVEQRVMHTRGKSSPLCTLTGRLLSVEVAFAIIHRLLLSSMMRECNRAKMWVLTA